MRNVKESPHGWDEGPPEDGASSALRSDLGSASHIRRTLDRVARALTEAQERNARSETLQAQTEALLTTSRSALSQSQALRATLRASVTAYVRRLHADHVPPERMLVLVKEAVREGMPAGSDVVDRRELMEAVVRWSIEAYYAA